MTSLAAINLTDTARAFTEMHARPALELMAGKLGEQQVSS